MPNWTSVQLDPFFNEANNCAERLEDERSAQKGETHAPYDICNHGCRLDFCGNVGDHASCTGCAATHGHYG